MTEKDIKVGTKFYFKAYPNVECTIIETNAEAGPHNPNWIAWRSETPIPYTFDTLRSYRAYDGSSNQYYWGALNYGGTPSPIQISTREQFFLLVIKNKPQIASPHHSEILI